jgi:hypothetical protein
VPDERRVLAPEVIQGFSLQPIRFKTVRASVEQVPFLSDDMAVNDVAAIHRHALQLIGFPRTDLLHQIVHMDEEHGRDFDAGGYINYGCAIRVASVDFGGDGHLSRVVAGSPELAELAGTGSSDRGQVCSDKTCEPSPQHSPFPA